MVTKWDDYLIHQAPEFMGRMVGPDRESFDFFVLLVHPMGKGPYVAASVSCHPNVNIMQGGVVLVNENTQYNFRASRQIHQDRADTEIGPLSFRVIEPLRHWALRLDKNEHTPVTFDLEFVARAEAYPFKLIEGPPDRGSTVAQRWCHMVQSGRYSGSLTIEGKRYDASAYVGLRDRSWGIRGQSMGITFWSWIPAHFRDYSICFLYQEEPDGKPQYCDGAIMKDSGETIPIVQVLSHRLGFEPATREFTGGEFVLKDARGNNIKLAMHPISKSIYARGGWSGEAYWENKGALVLEGDSWDLTDRNLLVSMGKWLRTKPCEFRVGNEVGYGLYEYGLSKRHQKYGSLL